jgi:hypothetical protein
VSYTGTPDLEINTTMNTLTKFIVENENDLSMSQLAQWIHDGTGHSYRTITDTITEMGFKDIAAKLGKELYSVDPACLRSLGSSTENSNKLPDLMKLTRMKHFDKIRAVLISVAPNIEVALNIASDISQNLDKDHYESSEELLAAGLPKLRALVEETLPEAMFSTMLTDTNALQSAVTVSDLYKIEKKLQDVTVTEVPMPHSEEYGQFYDQLGDSVKQFNKLWRLITGNDLAEPSHGKGG